MTGPAPGAARPVPLGSLVRAESLGSGGQGEVWAIKERQINAEWPVAYKQYAAASRAAADFTALQALVDLVPTLDPPVGRWLCERSAWPAAVVEDDRGPCGFLMRQVPDPFTLRLPVPAGRTALAAFQFLFNRQEYLDRMAIRITDLQRLLLLQDLAALTGRLHELGVAVGDLSANNLLFTLHPRPACFFIDCDAMTLRGRSVLPQVETAGWQVPDPAREALGTPHSDRYKYSLLSVRLFLGEQEGTDSGELARVDPVLAQLAVRGQSADPRQRPTMRDWTRELERVIAQNPGGRPPSAMPQAVPTTTAGRPGPAQAGPPLRVPPPATAGPGAWAVPKGGRRAGVWVTLAASVLVMLISASYLHDRSGPGSSDRLDSPASVSTDGGTGSGDGGTDASGGSTGSEGSDASDEQSQATAVDRLLQENANTRASVGASVASVMACASFSGPAQVFAQAASSRRSLLAELSALDVGSVPGGADAVQDLKAAWTASADADDSYQEWALGLAGDGCDPGSTTQAPAFQQAARSSEQATAAKKAFVAAWNPIADRDGLNDYSWDDV